MVYASQCFLAAKVAGVFFFQRHGLLIDVDTNNTNVAFDRIMALQSSLDNVVEVEKLHLNANLFNSFDCDTISVGLLLIGFAKYAQS